MTLGMDLLYRMVYLLTSNIPGLTGTNILWTSREYSMSNHFFASSGLGLGRGLSSSGLLGFVPSPTCSQGDSDSKFLGMK